MIKKYFCLNFGRSNEPQLKKIFCCLTIQVWINNILGIMIFLKLKVFFRNFLVTTHYISLTIRNFKMYLLDQILHFRELLEHRKSQIKTRELLYYNWYVHINHIRKHTETLDKKKSCLANKCFTLRIYPFRNIFPHYTEYF